MAKSTKKYNIKVWSSGICVGKYTVKDVPLLSSHTNDAATKFELEDGKTLLVSANCDWVLEEQ